MMRVVGHSSSLRRNLRKQTDQILRGMYSPLCGLSTTIGFTLRSSGGPRLMTAGGEMTGVHVLNGTARPRRGYYHIGGSGVHLEEAVIRTLGETAERYSQFVSAHKFRDRLRWASWEELSATDEKVLSPEYYRFYSDDLHARPGFPYQTFSAGAPMSWVQMPSLVGGAPTWIPAQLVLVGYVVQDDKGEPWLTSAVTTGSAGHTSAIAALRNCMLEHIQVDAAMGHWYSGRKASRIRLDARTDGIQRFVRRRFGRGGVQPKFYSLPSVDMPGHVVACALHDENGAPRTVVGLGCDTGLEAAMYSALLEGVGVYTLAKLNMLEQAIKNQTADANEAKDLGDVYDLDQNVLWYSRPENSPILASRFVDEDLVSASELPPDMPGTLQQQGSRLVSAFRESKKELFFLDLTPPDLRRLNLFGVRVWSPELLSLSLPSAPKDRHPRFNDYGGYDRATGAHPYP